MAAEAPVSSRTGALAGAGVVKYTFDMHSAIFSWIRQRGIAAVLCAGVAVLCVPAYGASRIPPPKNSPPDRAELERRLTEARKERARRRLEKNEGAFVGEDGVPVFTDQRRKYLKDTLYNELPFALDPIEVDKQHRNRQYAQYTQSEIARLILRYAQVYGVDPFLVSAVIKVESNFNPVAESPKGARGLMQLMPSTAEEMGVTDITNPAQNVAGGCQYLAKMLKYFKNDRELALAGYNAGPNAVDKYNGVPPYKETRNYVRLVEMWYRRFSQHGLDGAHLAKADDLLTEAGEPAERLEWGRCIIHFHSGVTSQADKVLDQDTSYYVEVKGRVFRIPKRIVKRIESPV